MRVLIEIAKTGETRWLRLNERMSFGCSARAQVEIDDHEMADEHFTISAQHDGCWLECYENQSVRLNQTPVASGLLQDNDRIVAGSTEFRIQIEAPPVVSEVEHRPLYEYSQSQLATGIRMFQSSTPLEELPLFLEELSANRNAYVLVNFKATGQEPPDSLPATNDLFQHAPKEIRDQYSLFLVAPKSHESLLRDYIPLRNKDVAIILLTKKSREELLKSLKFHFAWFAQPSLLLFQLHEGTRQLAQQLLSPVDLVFAESKDNGGWWIAAAEENVTEWQQLGLSEAPSNQ